MTAEQGSSEWFAARVGRVTGSMVGAILGLSPFMSRADAMRAMVRSREGLPTEFTGNVATQWGSANEAQARGCYEMETCQDVETAGFVTFEDWLGASPDGYVGQHGLVEFKCPYGLRQNNPPEFKSINDQPHYYAQIQIQLFVTKRTWCHFYQWAIHGQRLETVNLDQDWLDENLPRLRQFYAEYLEEPADDHASEPRAIIDTPDARMMVVEYDELTEQIELATERRKELLASMVALAGNKNAALAGRKLTRVEKAGAISYAKAIKELLPKADLSKWKGAPSSYWKLS